MRDAMEPFHELHLNFSDAFKSLRTPREKVGRFVYCIFKGRVNKELHDEEENAEG